MRYKCTNPSGSTGAVGLSSIANAESLAAIKGPMKSSLIGSTSCGSASTPCSRGDDAELRTMPRAPQSTHRSPRTARTSSRSASSNCLALCEVSNNSRLSIVQMNPPALFVGKHALSQPVTAATKPDSTKPGDVLAVSVLPPVMPPMP